MNSKIWKIKFFLIAGVFFLFSPFFIKAAVLNEIKDFYIDSSFDSESRNKIQAILVLETSRLYFYVDNSLWKSFSPLEKEEVISNLSDLSIEFEKNIYPVLSSNYGSEWSPGIDNDMKVTALLHPMKKNSGGYFNSGNEYSKLEISISNEREMVYINSDYIASPLLKRLLAHEFTHLITFNQKDKEYNIEEEVWLNEARAEYAPTLCGYDSNYQGSNLQKRVIEFLKSPNDSLTDWRGSSSDYGVLDIFIQYLTDNYGYEILNDSLHSEKTGIESIDYALKKNGYEEDFLQVFTNWTIAVFINDCSFGDKYCYKNQNLKNLKVIPSENFISDIPGSSMFVNYPAKSWSVYWDKIFGGAGNLIIKFNGNSTEYFKASYILCNNKYRCEIKILDFKGGEEKEFSIKNFNKNYIYLAVIAFITGEENSNTPQFYWEAVTEAGDNINDSSDSDSREISNNNDDIIKSIMEKIEAIRVKIAEIQKEIENLIALRKKGMQ